ncbi:MAG: hypothetical protein M0C28_43545 [Candidatus Moduliflexus flocculans]|nr:hypothetical protein [Candidatus Moduliflexus flocculans]
MTPEKLEIPPAGRLPCRKPWCLLEGHFLRRTGGGIRPDRRPAGAAKPCCIRWRWGFPPPARRARFAKGAGRLGDPRLSPDARFEIDTLKNVLRLWFETRIRATPLRGPGGVPLPGRPSPPPGPWTPAMAAPDAESLALAVSGTPYEPVLRRTAPQAETEKASYPLEAELDETGLFGPARIPGPPFAPGPRHRRRGHCKASR